MTAPLRLLSPLRILSPLRLLAPVREAEVITPHHSAHEYGGTDEIGLEGLSGLRFQDIADYADGSPGDGYAIVYDQASGLYVCTAPAPAAHKSTHEVGGADEMDLEGLAHNPDIKRRSWGVIHDFTNWNEDCDGGASTTRGMMVGRLQTTAAQNDMARIWVQDFFGCAFGFGLRFAWTMAKTSHGSNTEMWMKYGNSNDEDPPTAVCMGFHIVGNSIYGFFHDGTTLYETDVIASTVHPLGFTDAGVYFADYNPSSGIDFYEELLWGGTHTASLAKTSASVGNGYWSMSLDNKTDAVAETPTFRRLAYDMENWHI